MTAHERAYLVCQEMERRMAAMGVVTTAHYDAGAELIAAAIEAAVAAEREACVRAVESIDVDEFDGCPGYRKVAADAIRQRSNA